MPKYFRYAHEPRSRVILTDNLSPDREFDNVQDAAHAAVQMYMDWFKEEIVGQGFDEEDEDLILDVINSYDPRKVSTWDVRDLARALIHTNHKLGRFLVGPVYPSMSAFIDTSPVPHVAPRTMAYWR